MWMPTWQDVLESCGPAILWLGTILFKLSLSNSKSTWNPSHILWALLKPSTQTSSLSMEAGGKAKEHHESLRLPTKTQILRDFPQLLFLPPWDRYSIKFAGGLAAGGQEVPGLYWKRRAVSLGRGKQQKVGGEDE